MNTRTAEDQVAAIVLDGDVAGETAEWMEVLAIRRLADGSDAVIIDCTGDVRLSGHLLGSLRRIAELATHRGARVGVVANGLLGDAVRSHARELVVATTQEALLEALDLTREPAPIFHVGSAAGSGPPDRTLWWTPVSPRD
jgi:hypothetical protein